ncbi:MAG: hypothetical protein H5T68_08295 [Chloroflexi bacterium]|nr:hypothetical protein [Chloroflexota bacterium]
MKKLFRLLLIVALVVISLQMASGMVGAQGSWVSGFMIQNQDTENPANVTIQFYWAEGTPNAGTLAHSFTDTILAGKAKSYYTPSIAGLPDGFIGSVVIGSDRPVAAIINTQLPSGSGASPTSPNRVGTASGVPEAQAGTTMYVTQVMKAAYGGWSSYIAVQNTTADTASVTVRYYDATGTEVATNTQTLHPYSTYVFRQENEAGLPAGFAGSAKIEANKNIAVICNFYNVGTSDATAQFHSYNGLPSGATKLYAPRVVKNYYEYQSGLRVQNVGSAPTTVTVEYKFGTNTYTQTSPAIGPGQAWGPYMGSPAQLPPEMATVSGSGSAIITASQPVIATVNEDNRTKGQGITYNAFLDGQATTTVLFPQVTSKFYGYCSGIQIQNVSDEEGTFTVTYSMSGRTDVVVGPLTLGPGQSWSQFLPNVIPGQDFNGSAVVVCTKNIVGIANMSHRSDVDTRYPMNYGDNFTTYNGINK